MSLIDDIRKDAEVGTPGPWFSNALQGPRVQTNFARVFAADDDLRLIADCRDTMNFHSKTDNEANARRIARVPAMEAALLAAEELAEHIGHHVDHMGETMFTTKLTDALAAYRKATRQTVQP